MLAKNPRTPLGIWFYALSLSSIASKLRSYKLRDPRAMLPTLQTDRDAAMSAPSMTLYHNPLSPFVRKVMVLLHETGQQDRVALQDLSLIHI